MTTGTTDPTECTELSELKKKVALELTKLSQLEDDKKDDKDKDAVQMIDYYTKLTKDIEERRDKIHTFAVQLLAICVAGLTLVVANSEKLPTSLLLPSVGILAVFLLYCLTSMLVYAMQSSYRYPFLKLFEYGNKWKWFYYGNEHITKINTNAVWRSKKVSNTTGPFLEGLAFFVSSYSGEDKNQKLVDDLQQLFLLQVHNYYKNRFYLQLARIRDVTVRLVIVVVLLSLLSWLILPPSKPTIWLQRPTLTDIPSLEVTMRSQIEQQLGPISAFRINDISVQSQGTVLMLSLQVTWSKLNKTDERVTLKKHPDGPYVGSLQCPGGQTIVFMIRFR